MRGNQDILEVTGETKKDAEKLNVCSRTRSELCWRGSVSREEPKGLTAASPEHLPSTENWEVG